jgi:hypothetical protein
MTRMKFILFITVYFVIGFWAGAAYGQSSSINMAIPQTSPNFQTDRIRAGDLECSMAIGSSTNVEFGVVGIMNQNDPMFNLAQQDPSFRYNNDQFIRDVGVYGRITIPLGAPKERLNCNVLYQLELEKKRLEVMRLQAEIDNLRALKFEDN